MFFFMIFICKECGEEIIMIIFEYECLYCSMIYVVIFCYVFDVENILIVGKVKK